MCVFVVCFVFVDIVVIVVMTFVLFGGSKVAYNNSNRVGSVVFCVWRKCDCVSSHFLSDSHACELRVNTTL